MDQLLTPDEAAKLLVRPVRYVYHLIRSGELSSIKTGRIYRIRQTDLNQYVEKHKLNRKG